MIDKKKLIDFELRVKKAYEDGKIKAPVHLSGNNEDQLIEIFKTEGIKSIKDIVGKGI